MATSTGGDRLGTALARIENQLAGSEGGVPEVKVGFLADATYPDGTPVAMIAAINEFGAPSRGQPPRPFFRLVIAAHGGEWSDELEQALKYRDYDGPAALRDMGEVIAGQIRESIQELTTPELAESTIKAKGFEKPLIDTGVMWNKVDYAVEE